jgi:hypothetical protein
LTIQAAALGAGSRRSNNVHGSLSGGALMAHGLKPARSLDYKTQLLNDVAPKGFDAAT